MKDPNIISTNSEPSVIIMCSYQNKGACRAKIEGGLHGGKGHWDINRSIHRREKGISIAYYILIKVDPVRI